MGDAHGGIGLPGIHRDQDVEKKPALCILHLHIGLLQKIMDVLPSRFIHAGNDLQHLVRITGHDSRGSRSPDAFKMPGVGHHHALDVLDDVVAGLDDHPVRLLPQYFPCLGRGIGNGNGLGTTHGRDQFLFQNGHIGLIPLVGLFHGVSSNRSVR